MNVSFEQNHVVRVFLSKKGRRMAIAVARQDVMNLKEVVGWDAENLDQRILNRLRHFPETGVVILTFEHVDFRERHVLLSLSKATPRRRGWFLLNTVVRTVPIPSVSLVATSALGWTCAVRFEGRAFDRGGQIWAIPPSTKISLPVMKRLSSEARKATTFATSEGAPFRPMGAVLAVWAKKPASWVSSRPTSR